MLNMFLRGSDMTGGNVVIYASARDIGMMSKSTFQSFSRKEPQMFRVFGALLIALVVTGCGTLGGNTVALATGEGSKQEVSIDPINFVGVQWTKEVSKRRFTAYLANFPPGLFAEFHPLRVRYNALVYGESGKEYQAQALYSGYAQCALRLTLIVEGNPDEPLLGVIATTRYGKLYNLYGEPIRVETPEKLLSDASYRKETVLSNGTALKRLKTIPVLGTSGLASIFDAWSTVRVKGLLEQRTPLTEKSVRMIARENPELSFGEKIVGNGSFSLMPSWFAVAVSAAQDVLVTTNISGKGWDEESALKRGYQGMIAQVVVAQYQAAINAGMSCSKPQVVKY